MIVIRKNDRELKIDGHSVTSTEQRTFESTQACASVTAILHFLMYGIMDELKEEPDYDVESGKFRMNLLQLSDKALVLVDIFMTTAKELSTAYASYIKVI